MKLRSVFIGIPSSLSREALRVVGRQTTLLGLAESKASFWQPPCGQIANYQSAFTFAAQCRHVEYLPLASSVPSLEPLSDWLRRLKPDVICVCGMNRLLRPDEFAIAPLGAINLHPSLLPNYRGADPFYWQYHQCDLSGGVTIHQVSAGMDEGDILAQASFKIALGDPFDRTVNRAAKIGGTLFSTVLDQMASGQANRRRQKDLHCPTPAPLMRAGQPPTEWLSWPIERVWHFLRGTQSFKPVLQTPFGESKQWQIGEYDTNGHGDGFITADANERYYLQHYAGRIELLPPRPWTVMRKIQTRFTSLAQRRRWAA